jgi:hypothetical protein
MFAFIVLDLDAGSSTDFEIIFFGRKEFGIEKDLIF